MKKKGMGKRAFAAWLAVMTVAQSNAFAATGNAGGAFLQQGTWIQEGQNWKYRGTDGVMKTGWIYTASGWYYVDPATGLMCTGWTTINGKQYYFEKSADGVEGRMHTGWLKDQNGTWYFFSTAADATEGAVVTGWQWIDGKCYYFDPAEGTNHGKMFAGGKTADGYLVNADGQWISENGQVHNRPGQGYVSDPVKAAANQVKSGSDKDSSHRSSGGSGSSGSGSGSNGSSSGSNGSSSNGSNTGSNGNNSGSNGSGNNGNNSGSNGSDNNGQTTQVSLIDESKTKLTEVDSLGWWLPIVYDDGYTTDNTIVTVDGEDVTKLVTPVSTEKNVAKLALLSEAGTVTVSSKEDPSKSESVTLGDEPQANAVYGETSGYLPQKILTHGPVATWDYYLTNYDEDGNVRISPKQTTYDLTAKQNPHPAYSPDAVFDKDGNVTVTIMFNYNTDEEKAWFDDICKLELAEYGQYQNTINSNLVYTVQKNVSHGSGKVGELIIKTASDGNGQGNFTGNGRYYVRVKTSNQGTALVPIHVVNYEKPELMLQETPISGKNLHFSIKNFVYGIENPVERVTLKNPKGEVEDLASIDDQYLISSDCFVLYNDLVNHLKYEGNYEITIYANGFQTFSKVFSVTDGESPTEVHVSAAAYNSVDGISMATGGSSGSGSGSSGSGSSAISVNLIFDSDLLVNARLLEKLDMETDASKAVIDWWYGVIDDAVYDEGDEYYDWVDYINSVETQKAKEGRILPFAEYKSEGKINPNNPATAKEVLEDGLLGEIQQNGNFSRLTAPELTVQQNAEGSAIVLACEEAAYIEKVSAVTVNGNSHALDSSKWSKDTENNTITIDANIFTPGEEYKLTIDAEGYKTNYVTFTYSVELEDTKDLALKVVYEDGENAFTATKVENGSREYYYTDATFEVTGTNGDFLSRYLTVTLDGTKNVVDNESYYGSTSPYYNLDKEKNQLVLHHVEPGEHTISIRAKYYNGVELTANFTVVKDEAPEVEVKAAPTVTGVEKKSEYFSSSEYYRMSFTNMTDKELTSYLKAITDVTVNGISYKVSNGLIGSSDKLTCKRYIADATYGTSEYDILDFTADGFSVGAKVVIKATGYTDLEYTVELTEAPTTPDEGQTEVGVVGVKGVKSSYSGSYYQMSFEMPTGVYASDYLSKITAVTVNGQTYTKSNNYSLSSSDEFTYIISSYPSGLNLTTDGFVNDVTEISIQATGYKDLTYRYQKEEAPTFTGEEDKTIAVKEGKNLTIAIDDTDYLGLAEITTAPDVNVSISTYGKNIVFTTKNLDANTTVSVTIDALGYQKKEFTISVVENDGAVVTPTVDELIYDNWDYYISFTDVDRAELKDYLESVSKVMVGETEYRKSSFILSGTYKIRDTDYGSDYNQIGMSDSAFNKNNVGDKTVITISAKGYKDIIITVVYDGSQCILSDSAAAEDLLESLVQLPIADILLPAQTTELPKFDIILPEVTEEVTEDTADVTEDTEVKENEAEEAKNADESSETEESESEEEEVTETPETEETKEEKTSEDQVEEVEEAETEAEAEISVETEEVTAE